MGIVVLGVPTDEMKIEIKFTCYKAGPRSLMEAKVQRELRPLSSLWYFHRKTSKVRHFGRTDIDCL